MKYGKFFDGWKTWLAAALSIAGSIGMVRGYDLDAAAQAEIMSQAEDVVAKGLAIAGSILLLFSKITDPLRGKPSYKSEEEALLALSKKYKLSRKQ